ncbi:MAG TPA: hypothetical protein VF530_20435 [Planctomycetota bacterium]
MTPSRPFLPALLAGLLGACGDPGPSLEIAGQRTASRPSGNVLRDATPSQRFSASAPSASSTPSDDVIAYDLPEGWRAVAPTRERLVNLRPAGHPEAECYLSFLPGDGGGLVQNVNRWRAQLGAPELDAAAVAALPTHALLGRQAALVEAEGTFTGMGGSSARAGFQLLGLAVSEPEGSLFLKFTGPAELVTAERERFLAFAGSLRLSAGHGTEGEVHGPGDGHDHGPGAAQTEPVADSAPSGLRWTTPAGWRRGPARSMREVTFLFEGGGECYVTRLMGTAGGLRGNLDRWSEQMGQGRLADAAFETLPRVDVLGTPVPVLAVEGSFTGMDGRTLSDQGLLGVAVIRDSDSLFVKFTGPAALVQAERENFLAFLTSLEEP